MKLKIKNKTGFFKLLEENTKIGDKIYNRERGRVVFFKATSSRKEHAIFSSEHLNIAVSMIDDVVTIQFRFEGLDDLDTTIKNIKDFIEVGPTYKFGGAVNSANFFVTRKDKNTLLLDTLSQNLSVWFKREDDDFYVSFKESTSGLLDLEDLITTGCKKLMEQEI